MSDGIYQAGIHMWTLVAESLGMKMNVTFSNPYYLDLPQLGPFKEHVLPQVAQFKFLYLK